MIKFTGSEDRIVRVSEKVSDREKELAQINMEYRARYVH